MLRISIVTAALVLSASTARAQTSVTASPASPRLLDDRFQLRLRYGVAIRNGAENDAGPGLSYSGFSPNDLAFTGWAWLLLGQHLGLTGGFQREAFSLLDQGTAVTSGGLVRAHLGPAGRVTLGPARLEASASYAFQQLPVFGTVALPAFSSVQRHGVLFAARADLDLGPVTLEGRFEYPLALATIGRPVRSQGLGAGGAIRVQLFSTGDLRWGVLGDVQWHQDSITTSDASIPLTATQNVIRAGVAVDVQWREEEVIKIPTTGAVRFSVRSDQGPLAGVALTISVGESKRTASTGTDGSISLEDLPPGTVVASAALAGYDPGSGEVSLAVGESKSLELLLKKEKPKFGSLSIRVISFEAKAPVAASLDINGKVTPTNEAGVLVLDGLPPGPLSVKAVAPGYRPAEEAASVVAGQTSELSITVVPEKKRVPATVRGQVRNARGGKPVVAQLEIRELKQTIAADDAGAFSVQIPGGKYTVRISATGFVTQTKSVVVRDGDQAIFNVDLAPK